MIEQVFLERALALGGDTAIAFLVLFFYIRNQFSKLNQAHNSNKSEICDIKKDIRYLRSEIKEIKKEAQEQRFQSLEKEIKRLNGKT